MFAGAGTFPEGSREARSEEYLRARGVDPVAMLHVLDSIVPTPAHLVPELRVPTLVAMGSEDERLASARELVAVLPAARMVQVPGDHGSAAAAPELVSAVLDFLVGPVC
nr:hypothetical protein [Streptacidiphilus rugosus]